MKLIVGLGNPGREYERTRHNLGFMVLDKFASRFGCEVASRQGDTLVARASVAGQPVMLAKPQTYMNRSGSAVARLSEKLALQDPQDVIVVCDDFALPLGMIRIRPKGSAGGHNGLKSVIESIQTNEFVRVRLGIRPLDEPMGGWADFVLQRFRASERPAVEEMVGQACDAVELILSGGVSRAMERFNAKAL